MYTVRSVQICRTVTNKASYFKQTLQKSPCFASGTQAHPRVGLVAFQGQQSADRFLRQSSYCLSDLSAPHPQFETTRGRTTCSFRPLDRFIAYPYPRSFCGPNSRVSYFSLTSILSTFNIALLPPLYLWAARTRHHIVHSVSLARTAHANFRIPTGYASRSNSRSLARALILSCSSSLAIACTFRKHAKRVARFWEYPP